MEPSRRFILFYDAICPFCKASVEVLRRWELLESTEPTPIAAAAELGLAEPEREGLRSELLLWSPSTHESFRGYDGILKLLEMKGNHPLLAALGAWGPARFLGKWAYSLVSLNRRILSPPRSGGIACDCDPPFRLAYRVGLFTILCTVVASSAFLYALVLSAFGESGPLLKLWGKIVLSACAGWALSLGVFLSALPGRFRDFFWQSLVVLALGTMVLLPFAAVNCLLLWVRAPESYVAGVHWIAATASFSVMWMAARRRQKRLGFPGWSPWLWLVSTVCGVLAVTLLLFMNRD